MAFVPFTIAEILTDSVQFTQALWRRLRDNLETEHAHTTGQGKQISFGGITDASVTGVKVNDAAATSKKLGLTYQEASDATNFTMPSGSGGFYDSLNITFTVPVQCLIEFHYQFNEAFGANGISGRILKWDVELNGGTVSNTTHYHLGSTGGDFVTFLQVAAGTHTLKALWNKNYVEAGNLIRGTRKMFVIAYGR